MNYVAGFALVVVVMLAMLVGFVAGGQGGEASMADKICRASCGEEKLLARDGFTCFCDTRRVELGKP